MVSVVAKTNELFIFKLKTISCMPTGGGQGGGGGGAGGDMVTSIWAGAPSVATSTCEVVAVDVAATTMF